MATRIDIGSAGGSTPLPLPAGARRLYLGAYTAADWSADVELCCVALDVHGRLADEAWFVFYNQPSAPDGVIEAVTGRGLEQRAFEVDLDRLPRWAHAVRVLLVVPDGHRVDELGRSHLGVALADGEELVRCLYDGAQVVRGACCVGVAEIRAARPDVPLAQGPAMLQPCLPRLAEAWPGDRLSRPATPGLGEMIERLGGVVDDEAAEVAPEPAPPPAPAPAPPPARAAQPTIVPEREPEPAPLPPPPAPKPRTTAPPAPAAAEPPRPSEPAPLPPPPPQKGRSARPLPPPPEPKAPPPETNAPPPEPKALLAATPAPLPEAGAAPAPTAEPITAAPSGPALPWDRVRLEGLSAAARIAVHVDDRHVHERDLAEIDAGTVEVPTDRPSGRSIVRITVDGVDASRGSWS